MITSSSRGACEADSVTIELKILLVSGWRVSLLVRLVNASVQMVLLASARCA